MWRVNFWAQASRRFQILTLRSSTTEEEEFEITRSVKRWLNWRVSEFQGLRKLFFARSLDSNTLVSPTYCLANPWHSLEHRPREQGGPNLALLPTQVIYDTCSDLSRAFEYPNADDSERETMHEGICAVKKRIFQGPGDCTWHVSIQLFKHR